MGGRAAGPRASVVWLSRALLSQKNGCPSFCHSRRIKRLIKVFQCFVCQHFSKRKGRLASELYYGMLKVCLCEIKVALLNIVEHFALSPMFIVVQNSVVNTSFGEQVVSPLKRSL